MRISFKRGLVGEIANQENGITRAKVTVDGLTLPAINYDDLTGPVQSGDEVILNTVATDIGLGSGGNCFVVWNLSRSEHLTTAPGHIMKLRYTPWQFACLSTEEEASPFHRILEEKVDLEGTPVVIGGLHSQLYAVVAAIKSVKNSAKITYIMTDGAALPISYSRTVAELKAKSLLNSTITIGQAFGGDFEAVNIYSGLQIAKTVTKADIVVVMMGPGIVGTGTALGFSGIEQGQIINAAVSMGAKPVAVLRLSFADARVSHQGISHHSLTALTLAALSPAVVVLPKMPEDKRKLILDQAESAGLAKFHELREVEASGIIELLTNAGNGVTTMGRGLDEEPEFFMAAGAAGIYAAKMLWE